MQQCSQAMVQHTVGKGDILLVTSYFPFFTSVFNRLVLQTHKNKRAMMALDRLPESISEQN